MRIITGKYRGRHFNVPTSFKARPTTDFAKENIFNVLRSYVDFEDTCALDLFSGTGAITLELLSRGCPRVVSVEKDRRHHRFILDTLRQLQDTAAQAICTDALRYAERCTEEFDLVFADPPYALPELPTLPDRILGSRTLKAGGLLLLEHGRTLDFSIHAAFIEHRSYGSVNFSFFRKAGNTPASDGS